MTDLENLTLASSVVNAKIVGATTQTKLFLTDLLSYEVEGADRSFTFKTGRWDGRSSFFDFKSATFPAGFTHMVYRELIKRGHKVKAVAKQAPTPLGPEVGTEDPMGYGWAERYEYQPEAVRRLLRYKSMIARCATGAGKSRIAILACHTIKRMTLFLTTRGSLLYQMKENFENAGINPGMIGDSVLQPRKGVNVAMVQTIAGWLEEPLSSDTSGAANKQRVRRSKMIDLLHQFEFVIGEEAHEVGGNSYFDIMSHCVNAHYRLALTATPFMRPDGEANMRLQACFGSIGMEVSEELLINRGILAKPYFKFIDTEQNPQLRRGTTWPTCRDIGIVENIYRNAAIVDCALENKANDRSNLTLVQMRHHGGILEKMFKDKGINTAFIFGDTNQNDRKQALNDLASRKLDALIGSTILDVGVDAPGVGSLIIAGGGKAEVQYRQRIGRGLREKKTGMNNCFVTDFTDSGNKILQSHSDNRREIILNTPGFKEGLLNPTDSFPYKASKSC